MPIHDVFPYLHVHNASEAIAFYVKVFGVREKFRLTEPSGRVGHAELDFGGMTVMLSDEFPEYGLKAARTVGATPVTIHLHVDNADDVIDKAVEAGATVEIPPQDHFYGERSGSIRDPFGHRWNIGHSIEEVSPAEMQRRYSELLNRS
jgi:PhnB protein